MRNRGDFEDSADRSSRPPLTDYEKSFLDFGRQSWTKVGHRDEAIRTELGLSATSYYTKLVGLLDHPEAVAYAPEVVRRSRSNIESSPSMTTRSSVRRRDGQSQPS
jgi:hypothetical protein